MSKDSGLMIYLKPKFQRRLFQRIIDGNGGSIKAGRRFNLPASSIRGYKNFYFESIPKSLLDKFIKTKTLTSQELADNSIKISNKKDIIKKSLDIGREKRKDYFVSLRNNLPKIEEIVKNNRLFLSKWFEKYRFLLESNLRKINCEYADDFISVSYRNFAKTEFRDYSVKIPNEMILDDEFIYFFGLWCGDRAGGKRFGICNKNEEIIKFTEKFLNKYSQKVEKILYIAKNLPKPSVKYDKIFVINKDQKGWVLSVHSNNGIVASFFHYLQFHIEKFLQLIENKNPFFAGLFDAEGNVSLYNKTFRFACKNQKLIDIYSKLLKEISLYGKYDGSCLISYNLDEFYNKIFPYMKHKEKKRAVSFLCRGKGKLSEDYSILLNYIKNNPHETANNIAKALKKSKVYSELGLLKKFGFISQNDYPHKYKINNKGIKSLGD